MVRVYLYIYLSTFLLSKHFIDCDNVILKVSLTRNQLYVQPRLGTEINKYK
jgi:hypothetical protein